MNLKNPVPRIAVRIRLAHPVVILRMHIERDLVLRNPLVRKLPDQMPGDALFFHCNTLHSAGKNLSDAVKFSLVYTYHGRSNAPKAGTRSASKPDVPLAGDGTAS